MLLFVNVGRKKYFYCMKKLSLLFVVLACCISACVKKDSGSPNNELTSIKFGTDSLFMYVGDVYQVPIQFTPSNYVGAVTWASSDPNTVSISNSGLFQAKKIGDVLITVTSANGNVSLNFKIFVIPPVPANNSSQLPGFANDIAVGANNSVYITGIDDVSPSGGYSIKKLNGTNWTTIPECAAVRIAVGPDGKPWVVNKSNLIFRHDGGLYWTELPGRATDIAVGANGTAYMIGTDEVSTTGGFSINKWTGIGWTKLPECAAIRITVDANGTPWVVNKSNYIFKFVGDGLPWKQLPGKATDIAVGADGSVFITGTDLISATGGYAIKKWNGYGWTTLPGITGINISASASGIPYWVDKSNRIFKN